MDDLGGLGVGQDALAADGVEVALHELAETSLGGPFAAEDGADGVALEGHAELIHMFSDEPRQGHGQVEPQGQLAGGAALVRDLEDLPQDLIGAGPFAGQDFHALDVRGLDRHEAERGERLAERLEHPLARDHHRGGQVTQPAGDAGVDHDVEVLAVGSGYK